MTAIVSAQDSLMDEPVLTENAQKVLQARYLKKDESGACREKPKDLFQRVARTIAGVELRYGGNERERDRWERRFYDLMATGVFMPNSPTLMNAGREMGMLSACFVLPVRDSITDIFNSIKHTALIQKAGGGTGFAFDELRPTGDFIKSSGGTTSGPISFWRAFSEATNAIQQGAFRRGANMGMMYIHHPDILKFLHAKQDLDQFNNYNISVKVTDAWMSEFLADPDSPHVVRNPRTGKAYVLRRELDIWKYDIRDLDEIDCVDEVPAGKRASYYTSARLTAEIPAPLRGQVYTKRDIWKIIVDNAWQTGEPGVVFIDRINEHNPTPEVGRIEATNPCGEQPLLPYEACNLGSINLGLFVREGCTEQAHVDWEGLRQAVRDATRFLDNVIDANNYPLPEIERICHDNRKIGLGVMGFADALYKLGVAYNSDEGVAWGERFMQLVNDEAHRYSEELARERGCFPNWKGSIWHTRHNRLMRNAAVTTVAPTGTISIIANCSGGIEPMFSLAFLRNVLKGQKQGDKPLIEVNQIFCEVARKRGIYSEQLIEQIAEEGTLAHLPDVPEDVKQVFVCAHDISPEWHMKMQAAFQRHCDASISKTINFANAATPDDVEQIYSLAFKMGCKGVTVYRDGCRMEQPMSRKEKKAAEAAEQKQSEAAVPAAAPTPSAPRRIEPMDLPEIVSGLRIRQMTPFGNMHAKITVDPVADRELEVFAQLGKGGDVANSDLEAICRMVSLWLRAGGSLRLVVKQLEGIGSSLQIPTRTGRIMSLGDGLACALKKYMRAKERFGLRNLLLGEINLSELDNPNPAPHRPPNATIDHAVTAKPIAKGSTNSTGGRPNGGHTSAHVANATVTTSQPTESQTRRTEPPAANTPTNGNGNGNGHGHSAVQSAVTHEVAAIAEDAGGAVAVATEDRATAQAEGEAVVVSAAERRVAAAADLAQVIGSVKHSHDSASYYKVACPECGATLALQEGCRKCVGCGWSAC